MPKISLGVAVFCTLASLISAAAQSQDGDQLSEVVVTAQRFEESAQKAPIIIDVISSDQLQGVTDVRQLQSVTPGVAIGPAGNVPQTFVRGFGSLTATLSQEASVAYNADGVVLFTPTMISPMMYDLDRVEILKGPQGTLYGRNASAGAVNLLTRGARLGETNGYIEGEAGNFNLWRGTAAVNVPLSDTLAVRVAGQHVQHSGYLSDDTDDQDLTAGRIRVLWEPSSDVSLKFGADGSNTDDAGAGQSISPNPTGDKWVGQLDPRALAFAPMVKLPPLPPLHFRDKQWSGFAQLDDNLGFATLTVLPAYRYEREDEQIYNGILFTEEAVSRQKSLEVRLVNQNERLRWVGGAYYFRVDQTLRDETVGELIGNGAFTDETHYVQSSAVFGETTFSLTDKVRLIGGLRYTHEQTNLSGMQNTFLGPPGVPASPAFDPATEPGDFGFDTGSTMNAVTWKVGAEGDLSPDSMLFATVSRGFKGGGNYVDRPETDTSFRPEYVTAYELGSRNRFLGNTLQVNAELFYWKLQNQQLPYLGFDSVDAITLIIANAAEAHSEGADLDVTWRATPNDTFHVGGEYVKAVYDTFVRVIPSLGVVPTTVCKVTGYAPANPGAPAIVDCSGLPAIRAPKWSGMASYEHRFQLGSDSDITFEADTTFASSRYLDTVYTPEFKQGGDALFNSSLTYNASQLGLAVTGWIKNIADRRVMTGGTEQFVTIARPTLLPPRTFGITVRKSF